MALNTAKPFISPFNEELRERGFNAFEIEEDSNSTKVYSRKDFYKICLTTGKSKIHYADRTFEEEGTILFFGNPHTPYSWETLSRTYRGYTCLFSEEFFRLSDPSEALQKSPFFKIGGTPILKINAEQKAFLETIFVRMIEEQKNDYAFKDDLLRNHINLIIFEAMKLEPSKNILHHNASLRITTVFLELLERQFPIESKEKPLQLKTATDYANRLFVHVNHLNRSVKAVSGKSTSTLIAERIIKEAISLLQHTDWSIAEIAQALGFEYPSYFNNYFKRITGTVPTAVRGENNHI
jgi:AraC family transcriptional regulator, transcriptional activator of pobA